MFVQCVSAKKKSHVTFLTIGADDDFVAAQLCRWALIGHLYMQRYGPMLRQRALAKFLVRVTLCGSNQRRPLCEQQR